MKKYVLAGLSYPSYCSREIGVGLRRVGLGWFIGLGSEGDVLGYSTVR